jgi:hypothetical protein
VIRRCIIGCVLLCACVASESGNPAQRCNDGSSCALDQICYRGYCVESDDPESVEPISDGEDAGTNAADAAGLDASADASSPRDASERDDAQVVIDAAPADAAPADAAPHDAALPAKDASIPCANVCLPPTKDNAKCKKCVQALSGDDPEDLCGKSAAGNAEDQLLALTASLDPFCISLCLGAASSDPSCIAQLALCSGKNCGGKP